jgi:hypothetical protein
MNMGETMRVESQPRLNIFKEWFSRTPLHPFFLAAYMVVNLMAFNISQIDIGNVFKPLLIVLLSTTILLVALRILSRNWQLAGLLTSLAVIWFFVYGHLVNQLKGISINGLIIGRHRYLLLIWSGIACALALWLIKKYIKIPSLTLGLNLVSLVLICLPIVQIGAYYLRYVVNPQNPTVNSGDSLISWTDASPPPDIYYIVLDGYGRSDSLQSIDGIDNSGFLNNLKQMGFYVANCSQSNYTRTLLSLSSTFNMEYIQSMDPQLKPDQDTSWLLPYLKHNLVRQQLEQLGYKTIVFNNPWETMVWDDAAIVYRANGSGVLSPFNYLLLSTTVARVYLDIQEAKNNQLAYYSNYEDTLYTLEQLQNVPNIPGPKLVFVHLVIPHSPFVFGPDGEYANIPPYDTVNNLYTDEDHKRGYTAAVTYIDKRMLEIIPQLIQSSKTQPIIVLAGDHGTGASTTVTQNLEAFFMPKPQAVFYDTITPVNIFRVLFDTYFNGSFGLLPDKSYFSAEGKYFNFKEIPNNCSLP